MGPPVTDPRRITTPFRPINLILDGPRCAFMLPRRVASSTLRETVKSSWPRQQIRLSDSNAEVAELGDQGYLVVGFVRDPRERLASFWRGLVDRPDVGDAFRDHGVVPFMPFVAFAGLVCAEPDQIADVHWMSLSRLLSHDGVVVPHVVGRYETLAADWASLAPRLRQRGMRAPDVLPHLNSSRERKPWQSYYTDELLAKVEARYADDIARWYSA